MNFYTTEHRYYCGVDLHARSMYLCIIDAKGTILLHKNLKTEPAAFLAAIEPYRDGLVVAVECIARKDSFRARSRPLHESDPRRQGQNDRIDSNKLVVLLRGGTFPRAYVYPPKMCLVLTATS